MRVVLVDPLFELLPYTRCLADALQQAGCRVTQVGADPSPVRGESGAFGGRAPELFPRPRLPVSATLLKGRRYSLLVSQLVHQLRSSQPDVVHFQEQGIPLLDGHLAGLVRRTAALAVTFGSAERLAVRRGSWTRKLACRVDRILTHSEFDRVRLTELGVDRRAIDVLPCGMPMDTRAGPRCMVETAPSNLSHKVPGATLKTVVVRGGGRADPGMRTLIRAVHELPVEIRESCRFVVTDTNRSCAVELQDACREQCVEHLFHFIVGPLSGRASSSVLDSAVVTVFPAGSGAGPEEVMAALSRGRPVIGASTGLLGALVEHGVHGLLVDTADPHALSEALTAVLGDAQLQRHLCAGVRKTVADHPSWADIAASTLRCYATARDNRHMNLQRCGRRDMFPRVWQRRVSQ